MPQKRYVSFSIDTHFDVFDLWVEDVLCPRKGMSHLALTHTSMCLTFGWRTYYAPEKVCLI